MIEMEQFRGEVVLADCADERLWDWRRGLEVVVYLPAFRALT
jgi:hypothetical protein